MSQPSFLLDELVPYITSSECGVVEAMRKILPTVALALAFSTSHAYAQVPPLQVQVVPANVQSKAFFYQGTCGAPNFSYPNWEDVAGAWGPWETVPIMIVGVSMDVIVYGNEGDVIGGFSGNSYTPDPQTPYMWSVIKYGEQTVTLHNEWKQPSGLGMSFPPILVGESLPSGSHIDVHLDCPAPDYYRGYLFVWYTK